MSSLSDDYDEEEDCIDGFQPPTRRSHQDAFTPQPPPLTGWRPLIGHTGRRLTCLAACLQHGLIASGDATGQVIVWDLGSFSFVAVLEIGEGGGEGEKEDELFEGICGLAFDEPSGDLVVARAGPFGLNGECPILYGWFT